MVLFECAQHGGEVRVRGLDRGEQLPVLAPVVPVERGAEPVAVQQQVTGGALARGAVLDGGTGDVQGGTQTGMHGAQIPAPGDRRGRLAFGDARLMVAARTSSTFSGPAPPGVTRTGTGTRS